MTEEEKKLLEETARLTKENHKILKGMQRAQWLASFFGAIKWVVLAGIAFWSWMALQPLLMQVQHFYTSMQATSATVDQLKQKTTGALEIDTQGLQDALNIIRMGTQQ